MSSSSQQKQAKPGAPKAKKESILNLKEMLSKHVNVKFHGGRELSGILKGYDNLGNLVLDEAKEYLRDPEDTYRRKVVPDPANPGYMVEQTRYLGFAFCRGTAMTLISPVDGTMEIANPFLGEGDEEGGEQQQPVI